MVIPLTYLQPQQQAEIIWLAFSPEMQQYFSALGFAPGERISCRQKSTKNGISAYQVSHAVIALRSREAAGIFVKLLHPPPSA